ncbi:MAG TPA: hypothetical protein VN457_06930 [Chlamydiales bacterium]|nr:hypothetical protein [Chlamydiales bacterium]
MIPATNNTYNNMLAFERNLATQIESFTNGLLPPLCALIVEYTSTPLKAAAAVQKLRDELVDKSKDVQRLDCLDSQFQKFQSELTIAPETLTVLALHQDLIDSLDLHDIPLNPTMLQQLAQACPNVRDLNVSNCRLSAYTETEASAEAIVNHLPAIAHFTKLVTLDLSNNVIFADEDPSDLLALTTLKDLRLLKLYNTNIYPCDFCHIQNLQEALPELVFEIDNTTFQRIKEKFPDDVQKAAAGL